MEQCDSQREVEAILRGCGTFLLGRDTFTYALTYNMKTFLSSKWVKAYNEDVWVHADLHLKGSDMIEFMKHGNLTPDGHESNGKEEISTWVMDKHCQPYMLKMNQGLISVVWFGIFVFGSIGWVAFMLLVTPFVEMLCFFGYEIHSRWIRKRFAYIVIFWSYPYCKYLVSSFFQLVFRATWPPHPCILLYCTTYWDVFRFNIIMLCM